MITSEQQKNINRVLRWLRLPKSKIERLIRRYTLWMLRRLSKYGTGERVSHEQSVADREMQVRINLFNKN